MNAVRFSTHKLRSFGRFQTTPILALLFFGIIGVTGCAPSTGTTPSPGTSSQTNSPDNPDVTVSQANAARTAKNYLDSSGFSRSGLIKQLMFEGYSESDASYGADTQNANWNEQAARSAKNYLDLSGFSRSGLIKQLMFEGYSKQEAEFGATANGL